MIFNNINQDVLIGNESTERIKRGFLHRTYGKIITLCLKPKFKNTQYTSSIVELSIFEVLIFLVQFSFLSLWIILSNMNRMVRYTHIALGIIVIHYLVLV